MLNFRKLKQDFSSSILKEGKSLYEQKKVISAKILSLENDLIRFSGRVLGNFDNSYESEIEIDRFESQAVHSNCDCSYRYDCQHIAALMFYLEENIDSILIEYSKETDIGKDESFDDKQKEELLEKIKQAETKEIAKKDANYQKQVIHEYISAANLLSTSAFFLPSGENILSKAELGIIFNSSSFSQTKKRKNIELQLALRIPSRSKPLQIPNIKNFLEALRYSEQIVIAGKRYFFSLESFDEIGTTITKIVMDHAQFLEGKKNDRVQRIAYIDKETFGVLLAKVYEFFSARAQATVFSSTQENLPFLPSIFIDSLEDPLRCSFARVHLRFELEYMMPPMAQLFLNPTLAIDQKVIGIDEAILLECAQPGMIYENVYYKFPHHIKRIHLHGLSRIRSMAIPEPLFGTFVENSLPQLERYAEVTNQEMVESFITIPFAQELKGRCHLSYVDGELEASLYFSYDKIEVPYLSTNLTYKEIETFVTGEGILSRNLVEERKIAEELFQDFIFNADTATYVAKSEKKIVEFMTEIIPRNQHRVNFECPQNLLDQFIYDNTKFKLSFDCSEKVGFYKLELQVDGALGGIKLDLLWDCVIAKRAFIELNSRGKNSSRLSKILILDLERISKLVQIFDEIGIVKLENKVEKRPLWSLISIEENLFANLPVKFTITKRLQEIRQQILGERELEASPIPKQIDAILRPYQIVGVSWLERLRKMYLNGILADDMGLGKTLQAIVAITQYHQRHANLTSIVVCPTSLLYNWKEEINKFNPHLKVLMVEGAPDQRKKLVSKLQNYDIVVTSYTLMQKDIELYKEVEFAYAILDEAQHIKNRGTRNAKSVKKLRSIYKLILTGTPIENSLEELWSLFDFLMPGLLSSFERFIEKYVRSSGSTHTKNMEYLKKKVSPFILRRMKTDVLQELPPVSEIIYRCQLSAAQQELYKSYAASARDELTKLVEKEGFDRVQIHVLATLTRLKQICCHPAIFAKEKPEEGDSAKYEMLFELLQTLIEGKHKTVIFSQYTRMLQIMKEDLEKRNIRFCYLDGSTKDRLEIVKQFNKEKDIPVFLVSLKAGGTGLNIVGADTVIHYDMWWNPAVEDQATDRVHRIGQKKSVSAIKLVTLGSIEEKITQMQNRKKGLVKKVVSCDDEAISKLTWEEVLDLLQI